MTDPLSLVKALKRPISFKQILHLLHFIKVKALDNSLIFFHNIQFIGQYINIVQRSSIMGGSLTSVS